MTYMALKVPVPMTFRSLNALEGVAWLESDHSPRSVPEREYLLEI